MGKYELVARKRLPRIKHLRRRQGRRRVIRGRRHRGVNTGRTCYWEGRCHRRGKGHRLVVGCVAGSGGGVYGGDDDGSGLMSGGMWMGRRSAVYMRRKGKECAGGAL